MFKNFVYDNDIVVNKLEPESKVKTAAFYICGGLEYFGGQFSNNRITTNVPAAWIATMYGGASKSKLYNNTIITLKGASFKTFQIGSFENTEGVAENIEFRSNEVIGGKFEIDATDQNHSYAVYWTLTVKVTDVKGKAVKNSDVTILDVNNEVVLQTKTDNNGKLLAELPEYFVAGFAKKVSSPYTINVGDFKKVVEPDSNKEITYTIKE